MTNAGARLRADLEELVDRYADTSVAGISVKAAMADLVTSVTTCGLSFPGRVILFFKALAMSEGLIRASTPRRVSIAVTARVEGLPATVSRLEGMVDRLTAAVLVAAGIIGTAVVLEAYKPVVPRGAAPRTSTRTVDPGGTPGG